MDMPVKQIKYNQRALRDRLARYFVTMGGISIIAAIILIFFYLLFVVIPMFESAEIAESVSYQVPGGGETIHVGLEEQGEVGVRYSRDGRVLFFNVASGEVVHSETLNIQGKITAVDYNNNTVMLGTNDGKIYITRYIFEVGYPDDKRALTPILEFPLGEQPITLDAKNRSIEQLSFQLVDQMLGVAALSSDAHLSYALFTLEESLLSETIEVEQESISGYVLDHGVDSVSLDPRLENVYVSGSGNILWQFKIDSDGFKELPIEHVFEHDIEAKKLLLGGSSLMIGLKNGEVQQWMQVRPKNGVGHNFTYIRNFTEIERPVTSIAMEKNRKGFAVADNLGTVVIYYATSQRTLATINTANTRIEHMAWSERAEHLVAVDDQQRLHVYAVHNEYPEVSWDVLWGKVWYEGYDEPDYIWQSSASTNEFEPKLSLVPLSFGTIKAAVYAMLFAIPIAILGAIYTAQFMAPKMRRTVKPSIEIMEALPTVILGFLAGLWLAPLVEEYLAGIFTLLIVLPVGFLLCAWLWRFVPNKSIIEGWEALLLVPVVLLLIWISMGLSHPIERALFNGDIQTWLSVNWGMDYDQRNSLVVGLIMGFAVIPTIFSIAEDALFSVPQHLIRGSLALGATRWQTLMSVVLPAASPGIFSALMMGFGRAVGETMIVLMATGNTPVMDMSIFQGMRTLSANIAVEVPEAEVASTHYRVLFLAALVLFLFTFVFNTGAEIIRQRLRSRYSAL